MKRLVNLLLASTLVCTAVYAKTYKISPKTKAPASVPTSGYNVYTTNNYSASQANQGVGGIVEFVIDYSGSMSTTIDAAKHLVYNLYPNIPAGTKVGLRVFGQAGGYNPYTYTPAQEPAKIFKKAGGTYKVITKTEYDCVGTTDGSCSSTVQVLPVSLYNGSQFYDGMEKYNTGGATPLVFGLYLAAYKDLACFPADSTKKIILITDGGENCDGNPCEFAKKLVKEHSDIIIDVVLTDSSSTFTDYSCLAAETGGKFYNISKFDVLNGNLGSVLLDSIKSAPQVPNTESAQPVSQPSKQAGGYEYIPD